MILIRKLKLLVELKYLYSYLVDIRSVYCISLIHFVPHLATHNASSRESLILLHASNKGGDQPARSRSLISTFVIRFVKSIIAKLATCKIFNIPANRCS